MAGSPYASALGRLKPYFPEFLGPAQFAQLLNAKEMGEFLKDLESTAYGPDLVAARSVYQDAALVEVAANRTLVRRISRAFQAAPYAGRPIVGAYLGRWDIQNIELILAAKAQGRPVRDTEQELVSSREIPAGLYAGLLTLDDLRSLLAQPSVEAVATSLVKFGYGSTILPLAETFQRTGDIFPILSALQKQYYRTVLGQTLFLQGDEWVVRQFLRGEIDLRNALLLLKAKAAGPVSPDQVAGRWIDGGSLAVAGVPDLLSAASVPALAERLKAQFPSIQEGDAAYTADQTLAGYDAAMSRDFLVGEVQRMRGYPLSLAIIFHYLVRAEFERNDVRKVAFGLRYHLPEERIAPFLVTPRVA
jgi:V/A-type H+/Na+-transporting ATPase subunit C